MALKVHIVCDEAVREYAASLSPGAPLLALRTGEDMKTFGTVEKICGWLLENQADRDAIVYAVGGGIITDLVGFAASIYKRGIAYANYPTTLLAAVDAAVGGKTGVNIGGYKNMAGVFAKPAYVKFNPEVLSTLPGNQYNAGYAEMLKTFIIADADAYDEAASGGDIAALVAKAVKIKESITLADPLDRGERRKLNLGHTLAHAIEWRFPGKYLHGEAVAIGIAAAADKSCSLGLCGPEIPSRIRGDFERLGLPFTLPCPGEELLPAILNDKKSSGGKIAEPMIRKIGLVEIVELFPEELI